MKIYKRLASTLFMTLLYGMVSAQPIYSPPNGFWIADTIKRTPHTLYGPTSTDATWYISQYGAPGGTMLPSFQNGAAGTPNMRVAWRSTEWEIGISGDHLSCTDSNGKPLEFDAFASPNNGDWYVGYPSAGNGSRRSLEAMTSLVHTIGVKHKYFYLYGMECPNTSGNYITSLTLKNRVSKEAFYYQLRLKTLVGVASAPNGVWSTLGVTSSLYADHISYFGQSEPALGQRKYYSLQLLQRLRSLITSCVRNHDGTCQYVDEAKTQVRYPFIDRELANWYINGVYVGNHIWGRINATSVWDGFSLVEQ